jgi:excisionase family DNA binding protein
VPGYIVNGSSVTGVEIMTTKPTTMPERRVVTLDEAAVLLRISRGSAYQAAKTKEIPTIRIGRRLLVPVAALERMLDGNTVRA